MAIYWRAFPVGKLNWEDQISPALKAATCMWWYKSEADLEKTIEDAYESTKITEWTKAAAEIPDEWMASVQKADTPEYADELEKCYMIENEKYLDDIRPSILINYILQQEAEDTLEFDFTFPSADDLYEIIPEREGSAKTGIEGKR